MFDLGRTLMAATARNPSSLALVHGETRLTYSELLERSLRLVSGFDRMGISRRAPTDC